VGVLLCFLPSWQKHSFSLKNDVYPVNAKKTQTMTRKIFPNNSLASEAFELVRFKNMSTAITGHAFNPHERQADRRVPQAVGVQKLGAFRSGGAALFPAFAIRLSRPDRVEPEIGRRDGIVGVFVRFGNRKIEIMLPKQANY